jgi:MFS family permease
MDGQKQMPSEARPLPGRSLTLLLLGASSTAFALYLLLSVVPLYAEAAGGGSSGAGLATATFMLAGVLTQVWTPGLLARFGYRAVLTVGLLLLGPVSLLYVPVEALAPVLAVTLARGAGFGCVIVVLVALAVELASPSRRGEALGLYGVAITLPAIFANGLGVWLADHLGYPPVFLLGGAAPLLGLVATFVTGGVPWPAGQNGDRTGFWAGLKRGPLLRLFLLFASSTATAGVLVTFLPLAAPSEGPFSAALALVLLWIAAALGRWWAGRFADRRGARPLLVPGLAVAALGMAALALTHDGPVLLFGSAAFGAGFGVLQSATLVLTMERVSETERGLGSALWNVAFDAGTGLGALLFGFVVGIGGFPVAAGLCAVLLVAALRLART